MTQNNQHLLLQDYVEIAHGEVDELLAATEEHVFGDLEGWIDDARESALNSRLDDSFIDMYMKDLVPSRAQTIDSLRGGSENKAKGQGEIEATANLIADLFSDDDQGDGIIPVTKKARIEYQPGRTDEQEVEETITAKSTKAGSSSMH